MTGSAALVLCGRTSAGRALVAGLRAWGTAGIPVEVTAPGRSAVQRALADAIDRSAARVGGVVVPVLPAADGRPRVLAQQDETEWAAQAEAPLRAVADALLAARAVLPAGGAVVLVGPAAAVTGSGGHAAYAAAAEGARVLARSLATAWAPREIAVHWVSVATEVLIAGPAGAPETGRPAELEGAVAGVVHGLLQPVMRTSSGTTTSVRSG